MSYDKIKNSTVLLQKYATEIKKERDYFKIYQSLPILSKNVTNKKTYKIIPKIKAGSFDVFKHMRPDLTVYQLQRYANVDREA